MSCCETFNSQVSGMDLSEPPARAAHPSPGQIDALLEFFEKEPAIARGFSKSPHLRDAARKKWQRITVVLNSMPGCFKTWKQWTKYWADKKSSVKKKVALRNSSEENAEVVELTELEEKILELVTRNDVIRDDKSQLKPIQLIALKSFNEMDYDSSNTEQNMNELNRTSPTMDSTGDNLDSSFDDIKVPMHNEDNFGGGPETSQSQSSMRPGFIWVSAPHTAQRVTDALPLPTIPVAPAPRRSKRLFEKDTKPCDCKRGRAQTGSSIDTSQFSILTERLLQVEEQRLELDRRNTKLLETLTTVVDKIVERDTAKDHTINQAFTTVLESLKVLSQSLNKAD